LNIPNLDPSLPVYVDVLLPLAIPQTYTYAVPIELVDQLIIGIRIEVPLRNRLYAGLIFYIHQNTPLARTKNIISILDQQPVISDQQIEFWTWLAKYYCAHLGEVMNIAMPSGLKLSSESTYVLNEGVALDDLDLSDDEYLIAEAMSIQHEMSAETIKDILGRQTIYPLIKSLMYKRVLYIKEELVTKYKPRQAAFLMLLPPYDKSSDAALALVSRSERQARCLLAIMSLSKKRPMVAKKEVLQRSEVDHGVVKALEKKGIIQITYEDVSRINLDNSDPLDAHKLSPLNDDQSRAHDEIKVQFAQDKVSLLHGVTGSGKTRIYVELITEILKSGGQVLLLLPEIALTTQIVTRLEQQIGDGMMVYHSKINDQQRVEIWQAALTEQRLFVGARSAIFLPFTDLRLIIVDEEHDPSYKQDNPNPKYHGRDSAVMLAKIFGADIVLGSATPSLESMYNVDIGKYGYVPLTKRYGNSVLPSIEIINLKDAYKKGLMREQFSQALLDAIEQTVARGRQVILFQNRRGYAPVQTCQFCGWKAECPNCDVTLTYHQGINDLKCHYCGYRHRKYEECIACGRVELSLGGAGTERIEEVARFDYDTTRSKGRQEQLLLDFRLRRIDVLVGTQMITKGFDFEHIGLVGILSVDGMLGYPDFRAAERSFQLLVQVAGRAGRRDEQGQVIIQAFKSDHEVLKDVIDHQYQRFYQRESGERKTYVFPPHFNLITIWIRHQNLNKTREAARHMADLLKQRLGKRVQGPLDADHKPKSKRWSLVPRLI